MTEYSESVGYAADILKQGKILCCPTEGVWGLSCDPTNEAAIARLRTLKSRSKATPFILVAGRKQHFQRYWPSDQAMPSQWPGPLSCIFRPTLSFPKHLLSTDETACIRWTAHPLLQSLCIRFAGLIVSTSLNMAGKSPITDFQMARQWCEANGVDAILQGELGGLLAPTQIINVNTKAVVR